MEWPPIAFPSLTKRTVDWVFGDPFHAAYASTGLSVGVGEFKATHTIWFELGKEAKGVW